VAAWGVVEAPASGTRRLADLREQLQPLRDRQKEFSPNMVRLLCER
jgi:hypothetical protein